MTLPLSGPLSLNDIQGEFGGSNPININEYYRGGAYVPDTAANSGIPTSGTISIGDFYGGDVTPPTPTGTFSAANFTSRVNAARNVRYTSNSLTLTVTNGPITVTVSGTGSPLIQKNSTGSYLSSISFNNGDTIRMQVTASPDFNDLRAGTASMNGDSATFNVITESGGGKKCLAVNSQVIILGVGGAADRVATVADIAVDDRLTALTEPTMPDEGDPNWADWTVPNLDNASNTVSTVVRATSYVVGEWIRINGQLECTSAHPFLAYRDSIWQWITASELAVGDELRAHDGSNISVTNVEVMTGALDVMNVGVESVDTYYAGMIDGMYILNHNK